MCIYLLFFRNLFQFPEPINLFECIDSTFSSRMKILRRSMNQSQSQFSRSVVSDSLLLVFITILYCLSEYRHLYEALIRKHDQSTLLGRGVGSKLLNNMWNPFVFKNQTDEDRVQLSSLSCMWLFETPWTAARQASLSITNSQSLLKLMSIESWCHPTISSSVVPFSSHLQSFPASGSFPVSQFFASGGQSIGVSASTSVLPMNIQDWFSLGWTSWISL